MPDPVTSSTGRRTNSSPLLDQLKRVEETQALDLTMDPEMELGGELRSVNVTVMPLISSGS